MNVMENTKVFDVAPGENGWVFRIMALLFGKQLQSA